MERGQFGGYFLRLFIRVSDLPEWMVYGGERVGGSISLEDEEARIRIAGAFSQFMLRVKQVSF